MNTSRGATTTAGNRFFQTSVTRGQIKEVSAVVTSGTFDSFATASGFYQVPVGKKAIIIQLSAWDTYNNGGVSTQPIPYSVGYADTVSAATATTPTNFVGASGTGRYLAQNQQAFKQVDDVYIEIPAGKYPTAKAMTVATHGAIVQAILIEVDA